MSRGKIPAIQLWPLVFPALQVAFFLLACGLVDPHPMGAATCILVCAVLLNFTIHVSAHELLHYSDRHPLPAWMDLLISTVMGLTFDGYRFHHHNHHRHNNGREDLSRTWRDTPSGRVPYGVWRYALGWPAQAVRTVRSARRHATLTPAQARACRRMRPEALAIGTLVLTLGMLSWKFVVLYVVMVYTGWVFVSVQNYGQHPPEDPESIPSFGDRLYNRIFFNNGLHHEHHAKPSTPWHELEADPRAPRIEAAHLLSPIKRGSSSSSATTVAPAPDAE